jgi:hypothetical protein
VKATIWMAKPYPIIHKKKLARGNLRIDGM